MDRRVSIMITAILFAIVVAGSIAYLIYTNPSPEVSPTPTPEVSMTPTPTLFVIATARPTIAATTVPQNKVASPQVTVAPKAAAGVSATAPTGSSDWLIVLIAFMPIVGMFGLLKLAR